MAAGRRWWPGSRWRMLTPKRISSCSKRAAAIWSGMIAERAPLRNSGGGGDQSLQERHRRPRSNWCAGWRSRRAPSDAVMSNHWAQGGAGAVELGKAVIAACEKPQQLPVPLSARYEHQGEDRDHRARDVRRLGRRVFAGGREEDRAATLARASTSCRSAWPRRI